MTAEWQLGANGFFGSIRSFEMSSGELPNTVDELWKRIHWFWFIAKKLLCLLVTVSLPNRFSGASERAQKHPGDAPDHVTNLPKDAKKAAGEINPLNCHDTWPYTSLLHLFFLLLLLFYFFTCTLIHTFSLWKRKYSDRSNLRIKENNHMILHWFSHFKDSHPVLLKDILVWITVFCSIVLHLAAFWQNQGRGHICLF